MTMLMLNTRGVPIGSDALTVARANGTLPTEHETQFLKVRKIKRIASDPFEKDNLRAGSYFASAGFGARRYVSLTFPSAMLPTELKIAPLRKHHSVSRQITYNCFGISF
jgi:hypothetical protein